MTSSYLEEVLWLYAIAPRRIFKAYRTILLSPDLPKDIHPTPWASQAKAEIRITTAT
jgi:hypothetical protein